MLSAACKTQRPIRGVVGSEQQAEQTANTVHPSLLSSGLYRRLRSRTGSAHEGSDCLPRARGLYHRSGIKQCSILPAPCPEGMIVGDYTLFLSYIVTTRFLPVSLAVCSAWLAQSISALRLATPSPSSATPILTVTPKSPRSVVTRWRSISWRRRSAT
jgi:hypothetical protein